MVHDDDLVAQPSDLRCGVAHDDDRAPFALELFDLLHALALERFVADCEHFVDEQEVGVDVHGNGEGEPHVHARAVELHLRVDELLDAREVDDRVEVGVDLLLRESEDRGVHVDVLAPP